MPTSCISWFHFSNYTLRPFAPFSFCASSSSYSFHWRLNFRKSKQTPRAKNVVLAVIVVVVLVLSPSEYNRHLARALPCCCNINLKYYLLHRFVFYRTHQEDAYEVQLCTGTHTHKLIQCTSKRDFHSSHTHLDNNLGVSSLVVIDFQMCPTLTPLRKCPTSLWRLCSNRIYKNVTEHKHESNGRGE